MAHYPLYTQNLSLVGVCVKRIGKEHWIHKKVRSAKITNERINDLYDHAREHGALGGKLVGAGGGGFLLFYTHDRRSLRKAMADEGLREMDFSFDFDGSVVLLRN